MQKNIQNRFLITNSLEFSSSKELEILGEQGKYLARFLLSDEAYNLIQQLMWKDDRKVFAILEKNPKGESYYKLKGIFDEKEGTFYPFDLSDDDCYFNVTEDLFSAYISCKRKQFTKLLFQEIISGGEE